MKMQGVLFDTPAVIEGARRDIAASGIADRCELVGGDFFAAVPAGADAIMMKHIIQRLGRRAFAQDPADLPCGGAEWR